MREILKKITEILDARRRESEGWEDQTYASAYRDALIYALMTVQERDLELEAAEKQAAEEAEREEAARQEAEKQRIAELAAQSEELISKKQLIDLVESLAVMGYAKIPEVPGAVIAQDSANATVNPGTPAYANAPANSNAPAYANAPVTPNTPAYVNTPVVTAAPKSDAGIANDAYDVVRTPQASGKQYTEPRLIDHEKSAAKNISSCPTCRRYIPYGTPYCPHCRSVLTWVN